MSEAALETQDAGQALEAPAEGIEQALTESSPAPDTGTSPEDDTSFFDPKTLTPELLPAYKQMQGAFTKRMQELAGQRQKVEAYDAFAADPAAVLQQLAQQQGYRLTRAEAQEQLQQTQEDWQPQTWEELLSKAEERAEQRLMSKLEPFLQTTRAVQAKNIESQLDEIDGTWRQHEDAMIATLKKHPSLKDDVAALYRLSVPEKVWQARATQEALRALEARTQAAGGAGKSTARRAAPQETQPKTIQEAWEQARRREG